MAIGKVMVKCPTTGRELSTGVAMDSAAFARLPNATCRMRCPFCGQDHVWATRDAWLGNAPPSLPELPWLFINNRIAEND